MGWVHTTTKLSVEGSNELETAAILEIGMFKEVGGLVGPYLEEKRKQEKADEHKKDADLIFALLEHHLPPDTFQQLSDWHFRQEWCKRCT
jgi:hypothetical protein